MIKVNLAQPTRLPDHNRTAHLDIGDALQKLIYHEQINVLTIESFERAFQQIDGILPVRHARIQAYCQSIEELEMKRTSQVSSSPYEAMSALCSSTQIRDLFKSYSERLYKTYHLSEHETALRLEKQANVRTTTE